MLRQNLHVFLSVRSEGFDLKIRGLVSGKCRADWWTKELAGISKEVLTRGAAAKICNDAITRHYSLNPTLQLPFVLAKLLESCVDG